ncbi:tryptophan 2-C-methyltransferase [Actinobacteria bacterium YIM 96077]|uniref:Tryptophan 2-C-methyltransferase n=1 Tax=Phytoactinopolyspora halophila TaxID=1981511 RepID=A0A329QFI3_9ACTN|nr:tryptophan 2-C-methyltransferase [Phytoactinopolyspora halophila]AYY13613.1 tryptophan 2-C-methyltransferase [Actinobacteria bacterium YIM 96077]RAW10721.1 tryptophan 2-C-methyltransferase [Phytoactinopolyspora halophila]
MPHTAASTGLVTLVNPNLVHPPIGPYALDILTTSLEAAGFDVDVLDLTMNRERWSQMIADYFAHRAPLLVGVTIRNTDTIYPQEQRVFLDSHRQIISEIRRHSRAPVVGGGVGFSSMPFALVDYFDLEFGVKGPGEVTIVELATALAAGEPASSVPGLIINESGRDVYQVAHTSQLVSLGRAALVNRSTPYVRRSGTPLKVDNLEYYRRGGLGNILTKNGCTFACSHCVEPDAKGNQFARRAEDAVADELEMLTAQGVHDVHTTDSEFNLNIAHSKAILREIARRKEADRASPLHRLRLWIYVQPAPFDAEYAELLAAAGCAGINVAPDHVREDVLNGWKVTGRGSRFYTFDDVHHLCQLAREHGMLTMVEALLGMPGETEETMRACVDGLQSLDATVVGYTLGIRAFPYSPLGRYLAASSDGRHHVRGVQSNTATGPILLSPLAKCESIAHYERQFMFDASGNFRPVFFFSPDLPDGGAEPAPDHRWTRSIDLLWEWVPEHDRHRVMLPTAPGLSEDDNNYADNPFLTRLTELGYTGAFWSHWRDREEIMATEPAGAA